GLALHLWGDERLPRRAFLWRLVDEVGPLDLKGEMWARASVRIGNLYSLMVLAVSELPVDDSWRADFTKDSASSALSLYSRAKEHRPLWRVAQSNTAMLRAWMGRTEESLRILDELASFRVDKETMPFSLKRAMVLCDAGRRDDCLEELARIPEELMDARAKRFRAQLEALR
ncbi:MAG: hypothetical protein MUE65_03205, partial [Methanomassiliicoccales archaeon]|nr:hypothetical protein [Methanomassiliicoccales archaeon]